jgi:Uma2 family endonuclease
MGMPHAADRWTAERVRALPDDGNRYELIGGELVVTPAPRGLHQESIMGLVTRLEPWLRTTGIGRLLFSPADLSLGEDEVLQPDLFVYRTASGARLRDWSDIVELRLVVEVLSPSSARYDRQLKRKRYQRAGIAEYWIVDLDARLIERWHPTDDRPEMVTDRLMWAADPNLPAFELDAAEFFADVLGDAGDARP